MSKIIIEAYASDMAQASAIALLNGGFQAKTARISYNLNESLPLLEEPDKYPLILEGKIGWCSVSVHVYSVTVGYGGTGPYATASILRAAGFEFDESDILTNKCADASGQITLTYTK